MGRPKKIEPRNSQLNLSLTARELETIRRRAEAVGLRPVHFSRQLLLAYSAEIVKDSSDNAVQRLLYSQLARIGNNLNHLVRHLHRTGDPLPPDLAPLLTDIRQLLARRWRDDR